MIDNTKPTISREELLASAGIALPALRAEVAATVAETINKLQPLNPTQRIQTPEIRYDLKGKVAGRAASSYVRVNVKLLYENKSHYLAQTLPHEVCHTVARQWYGAEGKGHGYYWQKLMITLGLNPTRCHSYDTTPARVHKKPYIYGCSCGQEFPKTRLIHNRIQSGQQQRYCKRCKGIIFFLRTESS